MSEIFVAGDIHGNYQGLMESLNAADWQEGDTIICVGDVTDRGKDNARTVSFLQEHAQTAVKNSKHQSIVLPVL